MDLIDNELGGFDPTFLHLRGKRVKAIYKGEMIYGDLYFAGINTLLHGQYQVTLGRTPYWPVDPKTIELFEK